MLSCVDALPSDAVPMKRGVPLVTSGAFVMSMGGSSTTLKSCVSTWTQQRKGANKMLARYYVTGWCGRFSQWVAESIVANNMKLAKERFKLTNPSLKKIKAYKTLGGV